MARRFPARQVRAPRREMVWFGNGLATGTTSAGNTLLSTLNAAALALRPFTVVRTRLTILIQSDQSATSEAVQGVYSRQVVKETAAAIGVSAIPGGVDEPDADFYVYQPLMFNFEFSTAAGEELLIGHANYWHVDSKSMRKVGIDETIVGVLDLRTALGTIIAIEGRSLVKLH